MKKLLVVIVLLVCLSPGCSNAQTNAMDKRVLIIYLSRTNNTKAVAEMIHTNVGGDLVSLELENPYPADYKATVQQVTRENETGYLPRLKTKIDSIEKYDVVFLGFPTWGMKLLPPIKSFLSEYKLTGKTLVPFNTNGGYGAGSTIKTIKELCPGSQMLEAFITKGGVERDGQLLVIKGEKANEVEHDVKRWLKNIKMLETVDKDLNK